MLKPAIDKRLEWLKSLKVGDFVRFYPNIYRQPTISKIERETPTRWVIEDGYEIYKSNGDARSTVSGFIAPLEDLAKKQAVRELREFDWSSLSTQQLLNVLKVIQGEETK